MGGKVWGIPMDEVVQRIGSREQIVSIEQYTLANGSDAGGRRIRIVNGSIDFDLLPDRGLDIGQLRVAGVPMAWISPTGFAPASPFDHDGRGWLRRFGGGMMTTCGLLNVGPAGEDEGRPHPMHGRYSALPAVITRAEVTEREAIVEAYVRETTVFGEHLELRRRISTVIGSASIVIADELVNRGPRPVEPMLLYHLNFGWPLVAEGTTLETPALEVRPRDSRSAVGHDTWSTFPAPRLPYSEQVFHHVLPSVPRSDAIAEAVVTSPDGLTARVRFDSATLQGLFQWRVAEPGCFVLGIEPALIPSIEGRAAARAAGLLRPLEPGAVIRSGLELSFGSPVDNVVSRLQDDHMQTALPLVLPANPVQHFYRGGDRLAALRGVEPLTDRQPEEWLAATVSRFDDPVAGLTVTGDGRLLRDIVAASPHEWVGPVSGRDAADLGILMKLLDARQRLPVHVHPDRGFATQHLDCPYGKTEAWFVLETEPDCAVYVGWREAVARDELDRRREAQDSEWMLAHMNRIVVDAGMGILVPAGTVHAIDGGIFVAEVQEPTDFSILLEWSATTSTREESHLGLGFDTVMTAVSTAALSEADLAMLVSTTGETPAGRGSRSLLPPAADPYFRLRDIAGRGGESEAVAAGFAVVLVTDGAGTLVGDDGALEVAHGDVVAVPHAFGAWRITGDAVALFGAAGAGWPGTLHDGALYDGAVYDGAHYDGGVR